MMKGHRLLHTVLLVIFCISGTLTNTGLDGKALVFPKLSANSYVLLKPNLDQHLRQLTLCLCFFTDLTRSFSLFSAASRDHDNEVLLFRNPHGFEMCNDHWESVCTTRDSATGVIQLWVDEQRLPRKGAARSYEVKPDLMVRLGQEEDSYGACFDVEQSFVGEIAEVYLWEKVWTAKELNETQLPVASNPLLDWTSLKFETQGGILTNPCEAKRKGTVAVSSNIPNSKHWQGKRDPFWFSSTYLQRFIPLLLFLPNIDYF
ncbi:LOW QUALITY PROTEIN: mucosal pentraxin-like [Thamnophis elegans]|uniref:LOW QUALITY PROTEIN: mucosal pentraxin-like n=1 Tax=Thamnophis elegans TaxID=35005 RepID=UPI001378134E|nr:LOW QUALITY PROTEIN: mucosal pentraxin-like [Thamnophis elegans]